MPLSNRRSVSSGAMVLLAVVVVVAALRAAREIFIPFALAVLVSFLLAPLATRLMRWHVPKGPAVLIVVLFAFAVVGAFGTLMTSQIIDVAGKLPGYQENIHRKIESLTPRDGGPAGYVARLAEELRKGVTPKAPASTNSTGASPMSPGANAQPPPVEVHVSQFSPMKIISTVVGSIAGVLVDAFIVTIFVIFMLMERDDLRDRVIRLAGTGKLNVTTQLLDDASRRVSRYLEVQLIVNVGYGLPISLGLLAIGVPNPFLWGLLAALLRYIPYAGTWIAATMPFALAMAVDTGWMKPLMVLGLWTVVEVAVANFVEPLVYGATGGITPLAVLAAAVFWAWVWGPVGLLLSTPLTVCLVSMGRYIPSFEFLSILLGNEPALSPGDRFYQRLLAGGEPALERLTEESLQNSTLEDVYDGMILPGLVRAEEDRRSGVLEQRRYRSILQTARMLIENLAKIDRERRSEPGKAPNTVAPSLPLVSDTAVVCVPVRGKADTVAAIMLKQLLEQRGFQVSVRRAGSVQLEKAEMLARADHEILCLSAMPTTASADVPPVLERLREDFRQAQILVGIWCGAGKINEPGERWNDVPRENIVSTLKQVVERMVQLASAAREDSHANQEALPQPRF